MVILVMLLLVMVRIISVLFKSNICTTVRIHNIHVCSDSECSKIEKKKKKESKKERKQRKERKKESTKERKKERKREIFGNL